MEKNYLELLDEIQRDVERLKEIIVAQKEEIESLRNDKQQKEKTRKQPKYSGWTLEEELLENCYILDENGNITRYSNSTLTKIYNVLTHQCYIGGIQQFSEEGPDSIRDLEGVAIKDLMRIRLLGATTVAVIILICKHYGVSLDDSDKTYQKGKDYAKLLQAKAKMKDRVKFKA